MRMATEFLEQIAASRQAIEQMISLDAARRTVTDVTFERNNHAWSIQALGNLFELANHVGRGVGLLCRRRRGFDG